MDIFNSVHTVSKTPFLANRINSGFRFLFPKCRKISYDLFERDKKHKKDELSGTTLIRTVGVGAHLMPATALHVVSMDGSVGCSHCSSWASTDLKNVFFFS